MFLAFCFYFDFRGKLCTVKNVAFLVEQIDKNLNKLTPTTGQTDNGEVAFKPNLPSIKNLKKKLNTQWHQEQLQNKGHLKKS